MDDINKQIYVCEQILNIIESSQSDVDKIKNIKELIDDFEWEWLADIKQIIQNEQTDCIAQIKSYLDKFKNIKNTNKPIQTSIRTALNENNIPAGCEVQLDKLKAQSVSINLVALDEKKKLIKEVKKIMENSTIKLESIKTKKIKCDADEKQIKQITDTSKYPEYFAKYKYDQVIQHKCIDDNFKEINIRYTKIQHECDKIIKTIDGDLYKNIQDVNNITDASEIIDIYIKEMDMCEGLFDGCVGQVSGILNKVESDGTKSKVYKEIYDEQLVLFKVQEDKLTRLKTDQGLYAGYTPKLHSVDITTFNTVINDIDTCVGEYTALLLKVAGDTDGTVVDQIRSKVIEMTGLVDAANGIDEGIRNNFHNYLTAVVGVFNADSVVYNTLHSKVDALGGTGIRGITQNTVLYNMGGAQKVIDEYDRIKVLYDGLKTNIERIVGVCNGFNSIDFVEYKNTNIDTYNIFIFGQSIAPTNIKLIEQKIINIETTINTCNGNVKATNLLITKLDNIKNADPATIKQIDVSGGIANISIKYSELNKSADATKTNLQQKNTNIEVLVKSFMDKLLPSLVTYLGIVITELTNKNTTPPPVLNNLNAVNTFICNINLLVAAVYTVHDDICSKNKCSDANSGIIQIPALDKNNSFSVQCSDFSTNVVNVISQQKALETTIGNKEKEMNDIHKLFNIKIKIFEGNNIKEENITTTHNKHTKTNTNKLTDMCTDFIAIKKNITDNNTVITAFMNKHICILHNKINLYNNIRGTSFTECIQYTIKISYDTDAINTYNTTVDDYILKFNTLKQYFSNKNAEHENFIPVKSETNINCPKIIDYIETLRYLYTDIEYNDDILHLQSKKQIIYNKINITNQKVKDAVTECTIYNKNIADEQTFKDNIASTFVHEFKGCDLFKTAIETFKNNLSTATDDTVYTDFLLVNIDDNDKNADDVNALKQLLQLLNDPNNKELENFKIQRDIANNTSFISTDKWKQANELYNRMLVYDNYKVKQTKDITDRHKNEESANKINDDKKKMDDAELARVAAETAALKKQQEEAAAAALKKQQEEAAAAALKKQQEEAAAAALKKQEEEAAAAALKKQPDKANKQQLVINDGTQTPQQTNPQQTTAPAPATTRAQVIVVEPVTPPLQSDVPRSAHFIIVKSPQQLQQPPLSSPQQQQAAKVLVIGVGDTVQTPPQPSSSPPSSSASAEEDVAVYIIQDTPAATGGKEKSVVKQLKLTGNHTPSSPQTGGSPPTINKYIDSIHKAVINQLQILHQQKISMTDNLKTTGKDKYNLYVNYLNYQFGELTRYDKNIIKICEEHGIDSTAILIAQTSKDIQNIISSNYPNKVMIVLTIIAQKKLSAQARFVRNYKVNNIDMLREKINSY